MHCDVLVIGAGVAGLAATAYLARSGYNVLCLEALDRIGGRILTVHDPLAPIAVELGAEFVHGRPPEIWNIIRDANLIAFEHTVRALYFENGRMVKDIEIGKIADQLLARLAKSHRQRDETFDKYLNRSRIPPANKKWARSYVEGFNAARSDSISVGSLVRESEAAEKIEGDRVARIATGYDAIPVCLLRSIPGFKSILRLNSVVQRVDWCRGEAQVRFRSNLNQQENVLRCRRLIVTVPLGVLQAPPETPGAIEFNPQPAKALNAARALRFGNVYRVTFRFRDSFWETNDRLKGAGFLVSQEKHFPTWWTVHPIEAPILTGWMAGSAADQFHKSGAADIAREALSSLQRILNRKIPTPESFYFHDWRSDPFFRGAYSYVPVNVPGARESLAAPVQNTLFFAGEAENVEGHGSTVHGAIASGRRAAGLVDRSLGNRKA